MQVKKGLGSVRERNYVKISGMGSLQNFGVHNSSLRNGIRAVAERVFRVETDGVFHAPWKPNQTVFNTRLKHFKKKLIGEVGTAVPVSRQAFADMYTGPQRRRYQMAVDNLMIRGVERKHSYLSSFIKREKINFTAKTDPAPRLIQPRGTMYNVEVGKFLKPVEHRIYHAIDRLYGDNRSHGEYTVMKGLNATQVARAIKLKFESFSDPVIIGADASRFDQHVSKVALLWEHGVYNAIFNSNELKELLKWQLENRGFLRADDGLITYRTEGTRCSGDMNTALGNVLLMCAMIYAWATEKGIPVKLANNGDDCSIFMERKHANSFLDGASTWFKEMGFKMKWEEPVYTLEHIEFCQANPVFNGVEYTMVRNPRITLAKDSMSVEQLSNNRLLAWFDAIGQCGAALSSGVPVTQSYFQSYVRCGKPLGKFTNRSIFRTGMWHLSRKMRAEVRDITPEARYSFWLAFNILPAEQVLLEQYYDDVELNATLLSPDDEILRTCQPYYFF